MRPYAANDRDGVLGRHYTFLRTAKNAENPYAMIDRRLLKDRALNPTLRGILINLLDHPDTWEFLHIAKEIAEDAQVTEKTAYKYLNELIELGYVQKVAYQGSLRDDVHNTVNHYKVSELPLRPEPGVDVHDSVFCEGGQVAVHRDFGFPMGFKIKNYGTIQSDVTVADMRPPSRKSTPKCDGKNYRTNRVERMNLHSSDSPRIPLPLSRKGTQTSDDFRVDGETEAKSDPSTRCPSPAVVKQTSKSARPKRKSSKRQTPADFNKSRRSAKWAVPLTAFLADYADAARIAQDALYSAGKAGSTKWADSLLANPFMEMLQGLLGYAHWDYQGLRIQGRRLMRGTLKPREVTLLWCAKRANACPVLLDDILPLLRERNFRRAFEGRFGASTFDEHMRLIRDALSRAAVQPLVASVQGMLDWVVCEPCCSAREEGRAVSQRAAYWLRTANSAAAFFTSPDAEPWLDRVLETHPEFWALYAPLRLRESLPPSVMAKLTVHVAAYPLDAAKAWAADLIRQVPAIPGGLTQNLVDNLSSESVRAFPMIYRTVF